MDTFSEARKTVDEKAKLTMFTCSECGDGLATFLFNDIAGSFIFSSIVRCRFCGNDNRIFIEFKINNISNNPNDGMWKEESMTDFHLKGFGKFVRGLHVPVMRHGFVFQFKHGYLTVPCRPEIERWNEEDEPAPACILINPDFQSIFSVTYYGEKKEYFFKERRRSWKKYSFQEFRREWSKCFAQKEEFKRVGKASAAIIGVRPKEFQAIIDRFFNFSFILVEWTYQK
jgi:hypothetical protein